MKKVFLALMLVAAVAAGFTSCKKDNNESETHSQTFTLGETTYDIDNVITIENIQYDGSQIYNAIVISQGQMIGNNSAEGRGVVIVFKGNINPGTYNLSSNENSYPKYTFTNLTIEDIVNFDINELNNDDAYSATNGSFTLEISDGTYTITTDGIEVKNVQDPTITETSSVDYEGSVENYRLATVEEGSNINDVNIVTAGATKVLIAMMEQPVLCFITEEGNMLGYMYQGNSIPTGTIDNAYLVYVNGMDTSSLHGNQGTISIKKDGDIYTVNIEEVTIDGQAYTLHYIGTLPSFDLPF